MSLHDFNQRLLKNNYPDQRTFMEAHCNYVFSANKTTLAFDFCLFLDDCCCSQEFYGCYGQQQIVKYKLISSLV